MSVNKNALSSALIELLAFPIFKEFSLEKLEILCANSEIFICKHRQVIFEYGEPAFKFGIVLGGAFKLSRPTITGEDSIMHFSSPGDIIGAFIMAQPQPKYPVTTAAMGPSRLLAVPKENYIQSWKKDSDLIFKIQNLISSRMSQFQAQKAMQKSPIPARIAELLLQLSNRSSSHEYKLDIPLTRKEIADSLGVTIESVIRVMSEWSKSGLIDTTEQMITINKPEKLIEFLKS